MKVIHSLRGAVLLLLLLAQSPSISAGDFRVGTAAVVITPPAGTPMAGYYKIRAADGVLDDIYAKCIVVEQDGAKAAFVALDLATTTRPVVVAARKLIAEQSGIPPERVMISATHSHTGPVLTRDSMIDELTGGKSPLALDYVSRLPVLIAKSVADGVARLAPARAAATVGREDGLSFNRRFVMKDGTVAWNPAKLDPRIVEPAGPIDPDVGVLYFTGMSTPTPAPLAVYVNFAMHPDVVGGTRISADYPFFVGRRLAEYKGTNLLTFFANGCCGNINHRNIHWAEPQSGPAEAERIGTVLAGAVFKSWASLQVIPTRAPRSASVMVKIPRPIFSEKDAEESRAIALRMNDPKVGTVAKAKAFCILDTLAHPGESIDGEVQVIAFSDDLAIVALPGEIFVELGLAIKRASPFKHTFIAELANGSLGYIPNRAAYPQGNYEVVSSRCGQGGGEMLVDAAVKLLKEVR